MSRMENYLNDIKFTADVYKFFLKLMGIWSPNENTSRFLGILKIVQNVVCLFFLIFAVLPLLLFMITVPMKIDVTIKLVATILFYIMALIVYCVFLYREEEIMKCLLHVYDDWGKLETEDERNITSELAKFERTIMIISLLCLYGSAFIFRLIFPLIKAHKVAGFGRRTLPYLLIPNNFIFFDHRRTPFLEIILSLQYCSGFLIYTVHACAYGLVLLFVIHICGQLKFLSNRLTSYGSSFNIKDKQITRYKLSEIVHHHVTLRRFLKNIQGLFQEICFLELAGLTCITSIGAYLTLIEWQHSDAFGIFSYFLMLIQFTFNIFILCYTGELLITEGAEVTKTLRVLDWSCMPMKAGRCLIPIMLMSNYSTKVKAGNVIDLSIMTFGAVVRTTIAYLNLIRSVAM